MRRAAILLISFLLMLPFIAEAQTTTPEMATGLRSSGKIYVVVLVLATIFAGIIAFLIYLERRIARLEKESGTSD
jgi:hypothetical protein